MTNHLDKPAEMAGGAVPPPRPLISPSPGRVVWYWPQPREPGPVHPGRVEGAQPLAALIAHVFNDRLVNLMVIDVNGMPYPMVAVPLWHASDETPKPRYGFCEWMPYQLGQAERTRRAEAGQKEEPSAFQKHVVEPFTGSGQTTAPQAEEEEKGHAKPKRHEVNHPNAAKPKKHDK